MADQKAKGKKAESKVKKPSALKKRLAKRKKRLRNRSYRASVLTSIRTFEASLSQKDAPEAVKEKLDAIYSMMDKGVKRGIYNAQKAARTKSRLAARLAK